ncbi:MAG: tRNA pseudouridine(55) synthase TruB [Elusimicrobia bacterium]|jgi:tRNA pseudouridine55 synthase|nr:tRNA pseudouridine(55) synthase TruB [Elusimicrobiota bacterium]
MNGIVNIDKPIGLSSHRAAGKVGKLAKEKKSGHGGTLDPAASGVLIVLLGEACKLSRFFLKRDKSYLARIKLGYSSDTLDSAGKIIKRARINLPKEKVKKAVEGFKGKYSHLVPEYSAKKLNGEPFYKIKRSGRTPPERFQHTYIYSIELKDFKDDVITARVSCSSGTYIRSLASDIAEKLGTSGYLLSLQRTEVADFKIEDSADIDKWENGFLDINKAAAKFSNVRIKGRAAEKIADGVVFKASDIVQTTGKIEKDVFAVFSEDNKLKAIARSIEGGYSLERVFNL